MSAPRVDERARVGYDAARDGPTLGFLRRLREGLDAGLELPEAVSRGAAGLPGGLRDAFLRATRRLDGRYEEDDWGFDEEFVELVFPLFEFLYERWWRVKTTGI